MLRKKTLTPYSCLFLTCILLTLSTTIRAESAEELFNQANQLFALKRFDEAAALYQQALVLKPYNPQIHFNYGITLVEQKKYDEAITHFLHATESQNSYVKAHIQLGKTYRAQNNREKSEQAYRTALIHDPNNVEALAALAHSFHDHSDFNQAVHYFRKAMTIEPKNIKLLLDCANSLNMDNKVYEAIGLYNKIIKLHPKNCSALYNVAYSLKKLGRVEEALAFYKKVLLLNPDHSEAHFGKGLSHLICGDFEHGWPEYEWRWKKDKHKTRTPAVPLWDGSDLHGKTVLLLAEQGLGDTFQFIRYARVIKDMGATVIAMVQSPLVQLIRLCPYIDTVLPLASQFPACDVYIHLLSIPSVVKTTQATIPHEIPYLHADHDLEEYWKQQLASDKNFKVGICWQGNANYSTHFLRTTVAAKSMSLELFRPLLEHPHVTVYSLQQISGTDQIEQLSQTCKLITFEDDFDKTHGRFMDTAALIKNLDLVITVDTSIAHLAAGLGVPTWILLPEPPDWRWMLHRHDSPWYPHTVRLFRQPAMGDWTSVLESVMQELTTFLPQQNKSAVVKAEISIGELIDKITILRIKQARIQDEAKLKNINTELQSLQQTYAQEINNGDALHSLTDELLTINESLWNIEDDIREKEHHKQFDQQFIELARRVYFTNDHRGRVKRAINDLCGSRIVEEKLYAAY